MQCCFANDQVPHVRTFGRGIYLSPCMLALLLAAALCRVAS